MMVKEKKLVRQTIRLTAVCLLLVLVIPAWAEDFDFEFQQGVNGYAGSVDATIVDSGFVAADRLRIKAWPSGDEVYNSLIRFGNLNALNGMNVVQATLVLTWQKENTDWNSATIDIYPALKAWDNPTWADAATDVPWETAGAQGGSDRGELISSTFMGERSFAQHLQYTDGQQFEFDVTAAVRDWVNHPENNHGLIIVMNGAAGSDVTFSSNEDSDSAARPILRVRANDIQMVAVPDVIGDDPFTAAAKLSAAGLVVNPAILEDYSDTIPEGNIMLQDPIAGEMVEAGTQVTLTKSLGPQAMVTVPDVVGRPLNLAEGFLELAGLTVGTIERVPRDDIKYDRVIAQFPTSDGGQVPEGTAVNLQVSDGLMEDLNHDNVVNVLDFAIMADEWMKTENLTADLDGSGRVDMGDLVILSDAWLLRID